MKRHPATDALAALSGALVIAHVTREGQTGLELRTECPCCGTMSAEAHVPDEPQNHKPDCVLVAARLFLGRLRAHEERTASINADDVVVSLGNMGEASEERLELDKDYEAMVEDYIADFNQMIAQGQTPMRAFFAMAQAYAIVWGCCIRAGLRKDVGHRIITMILKNCDAAAKSVRIVTHQ